MFSDIRVYIIVGMFVIAGIALLIFNWMIILHSRGKKTSAAARKEKWGDILHRQTGLSPGKRLTDFKHRRLLIKQLSKAENIVAYSHALQYIRSEFPKVYNDYIGRTQGAFHKLADIYARRHSIERACYADFICSFPQVAGRTYSHLMDKLISYVDDPNIYCRTNVLRALCSTGNAQSVANALRIISDKQLFVHNHTLTTVLSSFAGDMRGKKILWEHLWSKWRYWNDNIKIAMIQFATKFSGHYKQALMPILRDPVTDVGVRIAIIRYYGRYIYKPARPILVEFVNSHSPIDVNLAIVAASALKLYPAPKTVDNLQDALFSQNWHLRYNASSSLVSIGSRRKLSKIMQSADSHQREIVAYMLERKGAVFDSKSRKSATKNTRENVRENIRRKISA